MKIWALQKKNHKIIAQQTQSISFDGQWTIEAVHDVLKDICHDLDIAHPVILQMHADEMNKFNRTTFKKGDFIEQVTFDTFELELIDEEKIKPQKPYYEFD